jgi:type I restriction enzyme, S subunit
MTSKDWKEVQLKDVILFNPRDSIKKGTMAKKISMDKLAPYQKKITGFEYAEFKSGTKFKNGDTLLARITPCLENGKTAQVDILDDNEIGFGSTEFIVMREISGISDNDFIYYLAISDDFRNIAIKSMTGTSGRQRVQMDVLEQTKLLIPPLREQKAIANILSTLDEKIETNNQINEKLEEMAQALFKHWFVDFEFPNENGDPYKSSGGEMVESELGMIPKGWEVKTINDISSEIITGKTPSTKEKENFGGNIPFVKIPDMHGKVYVEKTETYLSEKGAVKNKIVPKNSIMVSCIATPGIVSLAGQSCQTNQQINTIINKDNKMCYFNFFSLRNLSDTIRTLGSSGSATLNLNKNQFSKIKIVVPPKEMTDKYFNVVDKIFETIYLNQKENLKLIELRDNLLPKLMSGEIRVPLDNNEVDQS